MWRLSTLLAETNEPPKGTGDFLLIVVYIGGIILLVLSIAIAWKTLFGRRPPLDKELKERDRDLHDKVDKLGKQLTAGREEDRIALYRTIRQSQKELTAELDEQSKELSGKIETQGKETQQQFQEVAVQVAKMEQLTVTHTQQLHSLDQTSRHLLERMPRRAS